FEDDTGIDTDSAGSLGKHSSRQPLSSIESTQDSTTSQPIEDISKSASAPSSAKGRGFMHKGQKPAANRRENPNNKHKPTTRSPGPSSKDTGLYSDTAESALLPSGSKTGARLESKPRIPIRSARRTTMGVGGSGTSTLGLSYAQSNIFPIKNQTGSTNWRISKATAGSNTLTPSRLRTVRGQSGVKSNSASALSLSGQKCEPVSTPRTATNQQSSSGNAKKPSSKAQTMSRATASNYLNPHLRRRSRSGVFDNPSSPAAAGSGQQSSNTSANTGVGVATISGGTKARVGLVRPGVTAERQYLQRPSYVTTAESGAEDDNGATLASTAAAGAAGR
ncbi:hypothetical protein GGI05_007620, partial [Coemansia sp. RSA 2603]